MNPFRSLFRGSPGASLYVFAAVFLWRLVALAKLTGSPSFLPASGDMFFYDQWAQQITAGEWTNHHAFYGLPLYAYALALIYKVFGYGPFLPGLLQAAADAGTATLLFKLAGSVFGPGRRSGFVIGIAAAAMWALFVPAQAYAVILMPTAWLVFVTWLLVWQVVRTAEAPRPLAALTYGLLIGITAMAVATILFLLPLVLAALILKPAHQRNALRAKLAAAALLIAGVAAGTSPAWLHNTIVAHDRVFLSAHSGVNFWIGNNPEATGYPHFTEGLSAGQAAMLADSIAVAEAAAGRPLKRSEVSRFWSEKARNFIRSQPLDWLKLLGTKLRNLWSAAEYDDLSVISRLREEGVVPPGFRFGLVAALALPGIFLAFWRAPQSRWILFAVLLHMTAVLPVFVTERYRLAAVPGLVLFASYGIWMYWQSCAAGRVLRASAYVGGALVAAFLVSAAPTGPSLRALELYSAGTRAAERGDSAQAEEKLKLALAYAPGNAEVTFALGNLYYERDDLGAARNYYQRVLVEKPHHRGALNNLGVIELRQGRPPEAEQYLERALVQEPENATTRYLLAKALLANGRPERAEAEVRQALRLKPEQPEFLALHKEIANALSNSPPPQPQ